MVYNKTTIYIMLIRNSLDILTDNHIEQLVNQILLTGLEL